MPLIYRKGLKILIMPLFSITKGARFPLEKLKWVTSLSPSSFITYKVLNKWSNNKFMLLWLFRAILRRGGGCKGTTLPGKNGVLSNRQKIHSYRFPSVPMLLVTLSVNLNFCQRTSLDFQKHIDNAVKTETGFLTRLGTYRLVILSVYFILF